MKTMTMSLVLMMSFAVGAFAMPTASAHECTSSDDCDPDDCPDDGDVHAHHAYSTTFCVAAPSPIQDEIPASGPESEALPVDLYPLIDGDELFLGLA